MLQVKVKREKDHNETTDFRSDISALHQRTHHYRTNFRPKYSSIFTVDLSRLLILVQPTHIQSESHKFPAKKHNHKELLIQAEFKTAFRPTNIQQ